MPHTLSSFFRSSASQFILFKKALGLGILATVFVTVVFVVDQYSKFWAFASDQMSNLTIVSWLLGFMHHENYGIIANIPIPIWLIITATIGIILLVLYALYQTIRQHQLFRLIAFSLILAGAFGNLYDRIIFGFVRDWILLFNRSVINIADISIFVGVFLLLMTGHKMKIGGVEEEVSSK